MHKYLFVAIENGQCVIRKILKSRYQGIKKLESLLHDGVMVDDIVYHDKRQHLQEFICSDGSRFLIYRV